MTTDHVHTWPLPHTRPIRRPDANQPIRVAFEYDPHADSFAVEINNPDINPHDLAEVINYGTELIVDDFTETPDMYYNVLATIGAQLLHRANQPRTYL